MSKAQAHQKSEKQLKTAKVKAASNPKPFLHIVCGIEGSWTPTDTEMKEIERRFEEVIKNGGVIATREGVRVDWQFYKRR